MIDVRDLVFDYLGHRALHGVSVQLPAGTVTALVGPNGAGKSTLMRCMAGLDTPLSGSIHVDGIDVQEHPRAVHTRLGYLSDFFGLYQSLSVAQCLHYAAAAQGLNARAIPARIDEVAHCLQLQELLNRPAGNLSRGQRQRVAIGQAIVHNPRVLLLDEPASGLDPEARSELSTLFRALQARGMTLVVSSHILSELDEYCTHILAIREGRVSRYGSLHPESFNTGGVQRIRLQIQLAAPAPQLPALLADCDTGEVDPSARQPSTVYLPAADLSARAALLTRLVAAGVPVCGFQEVRTSLQASYAKEDSAAEESRP